MRKKTYLKLVEYHTEQSERHLKEVRTIYMKMRGYKHDFHHHLQTLKGQLETGEVDRALAYIEALDRELRTVDTLLRTGNVSLDAILSAKTAQARAEGIEVSVRACVPDTLTFSDVELSILAGNLLDNALEAAGQTEVPEQRFVRLRVRRINQMLVIKVENGCAAAPVAEGGELRTTKTDGGLHGWGLKSARTAAEKYDGMVQTDCEGHIFRAVVTLSYL